jgi:hypothetical protein
VNGLHQRQADRVRLLSNIHREILFGWISRTTALVVSLALMIVASAVAQAQQPKLEMHRVGVNADDGSGWHQAVSKQRC